MRIPELLMMDFDSREKAAGAVSDLIAAVLREEIAQTGRAVFLSSGGSTPAETLEELSKQDVDWGNVQVGLVDDRCVGAHHEASNARLLKRHLLKNKASSAHFEPMIVEGVSLSEITDRANDRYESLIPPTFTLLGMGSDGHTASWFPGAENLHDAMDDTDRRVVAIDATGCPVAGDITDRLTLTRCAIAQSHRALLLIFGDEKRDAFFNAMSRPHSQAPIRVAVEDLGNRLITVWAP